MQPSLDTRRHDDGTIDFDFYRRSAARRRRRARRLMFRQLGDAARRILRASVAAVASATTRLWLDPSYSGLRAVTIARSRRATDAEPHAVNRSVDAARPRLK